MYKTDNFIEKLIEIHPISIQEKEEISKILSFHNFKPKQLLLLKEEVSDCVFFVLEGLVRGFMKTKRIKSTALGLCLKEALYILS